MARLAARRCADSVPLRGAQMCRSRSLVHWWVRDYWCMTPDDERTIQECLRAAVEGPFFPEWEFQTLMGLERAEVAAVLAEWPGTTRSDDQVVAVNNVLNNLLGYPHAASEQTWRSYIEASPREVADVLSRWRADGDHDPSAEGYFNRLM